MISRKLMALLVVSAGLAWFSRGAEDTPASTRRPTYLPTTAPAVVPGGEVTALVTGKPWQRTILLPAIAPVEPVIQAPVYEPPPLAPVEPPPPEIPSAPPLPVTYLGKLQDKKMLSLYIRYQEQPISLHTGELLGEDYRLETIAADHALFRYLPLDTLQELRWDGQ